MEVVFGRPLKTNKVEACAVASTSGAVLAVCSCGVLPMFAGIYLSLKYGFEAF